MTRFGKLITFLFLLVVAGVVYFVMVNKQEPYEIENFIREDGADLVYEESSDYYNISAKYPNNTHATVDAELFVLSEIGEFKDFFDGLSEEEKKVIQESAAGAYQFSITYEKKEGSGFTTYIFTEYEYTGGAHGNTDISTITYAPDKTRIEIQDIVKSDPQNITAIATLVEEELLAKTEEGGIFYEGVSPRFENFDQFYFTDEKIVFVFPPYQVASYALGTLEAKLSLSEVFGYLKKDHISSWYEEEKEFRGNIIFGSEVRSFSYCEGEEEYWYHDTTGSLEDEYTHAKLSEDAYEKIPVIVRGYIRDIPESESGFAEEYDGILVVSDLDQVGGGGVCE